MLALVGVAAMGQDLAVGKMLVATRKSKDADLARSVILLVHYGRQGVIGLMLNRPSKVPLSDVMPELKRAAIPVFAGGPITIGVRALVRSKTKLDPAERMFGDVYVVSTKMLLENVVQPPNIVRVYAGYTGWSVEQLKDEVARGLWRVLAADTGAVFDPHPDALWSRLINSPRSKM